MENKYTIGLVLVALLSVSLIYSDVLAGEGRDVSGNLHQRFQQWKRTYGMNFEGQEESYRFQVFRKNLADIERHNAIPSRTYDMGLNMFSHLSNQEFVQKYLTTVDLSKQSHIRTQDKQQEEPMEILGDVDWEVLGKVSPVKSQGACDAGYAFCSVSLVQSSLLIKGQRVLLSEQQVVDCSSNYTTFGCNSGSRAGTLKFAKQKGLVQQANYAYTGKVGQCKNATGNYTIKFNILESNGCEQIKTNLYKTPMTIAVNAQTWQSYMTGVYNGCTSTQVNHDVFLVGVTTGYWRVKNSWGIRWGEYGYIRLALGNTCGICEKTGFGIGAYA